MTKQKSWQDKCQKELDTQGLDMEVDMFRCGNLEMVCRTVYHSLIADGKTAAGFPSCVKVYPVVK